MVRAVSFIREPLLTTDHSPLRLKLRSLGDLPRVGQPTPARHPVAHATRLADHSLLINPSTNLRFATPAPVGNRPSSG
jgi:hypothetical protein